MALERDDGSLMPVGSSKRDLSPKTETSHTERWEITFRATVPAGLSADSPLTSAAGILQRRMTQVLQQAGVSDPEVQVRKIGRSSHRGQWEPGVDYEPGETVMWHQTYWRATERNCNIKPDGDRNKRRGTWLFTTYIHEQPDPFFAVMEQPRQALVEATNASGDEIMAVVDVDDIVDAEIIE